MNIGLNTYHAIKTVTGGFLFWKRTSQVIVATTVASSWMWAERNLACDCVEYDMLTKQV